MQLCRLALLSLALLGSCASWPEVEPELDLSWRGLHVYVSDSAYILATGSGAAKDARGKLEAASQAIAELAGEELAMGVVVVVDAGDPLLMSDPAELMVTLREWHRQETEGLSLDNTGVEIDWEDGLDRSLVARMLLAAIPLDEDPLGLPEALRGRVGWGVVLPTRGAFEASLDAAMEKELGELSIGKRLMAEAMLPFMVGEVLDKIELAMQLRLYQACLGGLSLPADRKAEIYRELERQNR